MRFRKLRIAWSVGWGVVCVGLAALWILSDQIDPYVKFGRLKIEDGKVAGIYAGRGYIGLYAKYVPADRNVDVDGSYPGGPIYMQPFWRVLLVSGILPCVAWINWPKRYSLRTPLIATTVIAVVLGMSVWMSRAG